MVMASEAGGIGGGDAIAVLVVVAIKLSHEEAIPAILKKNNINII